MKKTLLATASALAFAAVSTPALAQAGDWNSGWSGILSGDYNYTNYSGDSEHYLEVNGTAAVPLGFGELTLQGHAEGQTMVGSNFDEAWSIGTFDGTLFWTGPDMRVAVSIQKQLWEDLNPWNAELGAEYYLAPDLTIALKGGVTWEIYDSAVGARGNFGGQVTYYCDPNVALSLSYDNWVTPYDAADRDIAFQVEDLLWDQVSLFAGYGYSDSAHEPVNLVTVGIKLYTDGGMTLVDHQRQGPAGYISTFNPVWLHH